MADIKNIFERKNIGNKIKWEKVIYDDDNYQLKKFLKELSYSKKTYNQKDNFSFHSSFEQRYPKYQRVTFKAHYGKTMISHNKYLHTYMIQNDKDDVIEKPELFGTDIDEYEKNKEEKHFKFIISPENQNVDLEILVKDFVKRIELLTGYKIYYEAAIHKNTNHKHAHLCINGKDKSGRDIWFDKEFIKKHFREMLSVGCTNLIGERTFKEIELSKMNLFQSKRFTELDEKLLSISNNEINTKKLGNALTNRILFLADLNLVEKVKDDVYKFKNNWAEVLMASGRYNSYLDEYLKDTSIEIYSGQKIEGKVIKVIDFDKDESWNDAVVVLTKDNKKIYVPVYQLQREDLLEKNIKIREKKNKYLPQVNDSDIYLNL